MRSQRQTFNSSNLISSAHRLRCIHPVIFTLCTQHCQHIHSHHWSGVLKCDHRCKPMDGRWWLWACRLRNTGIWSYSSDCNPRIEFSIPGSRIKKFVIQGSWDPILELGSQIGRHFNILYWLISCIWCSIGPYGRYIRTAGSDNDCQNTNYSAQQTVEL